MDRPEVKAVGIEVHKIVNQVRNKNLSISSIVKDYYAKNGVLEILEHSSVEEMYEKSDLDLPPKFTKENVKTCLEYANENEHMVGNIIEEDQELKDILFGRNGVRNKYEIQNKLEKTNFDYFDVNFTITEDGFSVNWNQE